MQPYDVAAPISTKFVFLFNELIKPSNEFEKYLHVNLQGEVL